MKMNLIVENLHGASKLEILTEQTQHGKKLFIEGPMVMTNQKNRNGRNYDFDTVGVPSVDRYIQEYVNDRRAIGEVEHPDYPFPKLSKAAIKVDSLVWEGFNSIGKAQVLNNENGQIIRSLIEADFNMAVSTRGLGDVENRNGVDEVLPGFMLTAVDVVDRPSGQVCYMKALKEGIDWQMNESGIAVPVDFSDSVDSIINENRLLENDFLLRFEKAVSKLG